MTDLAVLPHETSPEHAPSIHLLVADDDDGVRSLLAACARDAVPHATAVLEARDGDEALQLALRRRPQIALLDVDMPGPGGMEVASRLRALQPRMRLALHTADPDEHREQALARRLPLFDKFEIGRAVSWLEVQVQACAGDHSPRPQPPQKAALGCSSCGYGIVCSSPPRRCPMCEAEDSWIGAPWRPFRHAVASTRDRLSCYRAAEAAGAGWGG